MFDCKRQVDALCQLQSGERPSTLHVPPSWTDDELKDRQALARGVMRGAIGYEYITRVELSETLEAALTLEDNGDENASSDWRPLPVSNFTDGWDTSYTEGIIQEALPEDRVRFSEYIRARVLGLGVLTAGPGFGKTTAMAAAALAMQHSLGKILLSAPSNVAVDNLAARVDRTSMSIAERCNKDKAPSDLTRVRRRLVVRGYKSEEDFHALRALLRDPSLGDNARPNRHGKPTRWKLNLSVSFWLLLLLRSPAVDRQIHEDDPQVLHDMQSYLDGRSDMKDLRAYATGRMPYEQFVKAKTPMAIISKLSQRLIDAADFLAVTPSMARIDPAYSVWYRENPKGVAIDEAANMNRGDFISAWGNVLLPCFMGGDPKQLPPTVMTTQEQTIEGKVINPMEKEGAVSAQEFIQAAGIPTYRLRKQLRLAKGLWTIPSAVFYPDLPEVYGDNCEVNLPQFKIGRDLEDFVRASYPETTPPDAGCLSPLFVHCEGTSVFVNPETKSKRSADQVKVALDFALKFVRAKAVDPSRLVILGFYNDNVQLVERWRKRDAWKELAGMPSASTIDSYQGQENDVVILIMGTRAHWPGPGFTRNPQRLNVALTRQRCGLVIVGDIDVAGPVDKAKAKKEHVRKGEFLLMEPGKRITKGFAVELHQVCKMLTEAGRVARIRVNVKDAEDAQMEAERDDGLDEKRGL
ncbi:P-loop containing nucleoside triphosphate hydrolase protein [Colletotrichum cereale]|nr:P-loop containing nucleoside triphosphate hydrolase protein [Colletotrichum cereale]